MAARTYYDALSEAMAQPTPIYRPPNPRRVTEPYSTAYGAPAEPPEIPEPEPPPGTTTTTTSGTGASGNTGSSANRSTWNTEGYAAPAYTPASYGGVMPGWEASNWSNADMQTPKYGVGRILSNYDPNDASSLAAAIAEIQKAYPGATFDGKDLLTIPGVGVTDIIRGAGAPGAGWQWADPSAGGGGGASGGGSGTGDTSAVTGMIGGVPNDFLAQILSAVQTLMGGGGANRNALLQTLQTPPR